MSARINPYNEPDFLAACRSGDLQWVKEQLSRDASLAYQEYRSGKRDCMVVPLYMACQEGHDDIVRVLLEQGVDVNATAHALKRTPLMTAAREGHNRIVEQLLRHPEIDVNTAAADYSPLLAAVRTGNRDTVVQLLRHPRTNVNAAGLHGITPLSLAAYLGLIEIVKVLVSHKGIDLTVTDDSGHTAVLTACKQGHQEVAVYLARALSEVSEESYTQIAFRYAVRGDNLPWLRELLEKNPALARQKFPFYKNAKECYPLHTAVRKRNRAMVELFLAKGATINAVSEQGETALWLAAEEGLGEIVEFLLSRRDIDVNAAVRGGATPLFIAAQNGHTDVVRQLLDKGADSRLKWKVNLIESRSPLQAAQKNKHREVVSLLQAGGRKPQKVSENTPLLSVANE